MKTLFAIIAFVVSSLSVSAHSTLWRPSPYVVPSKQGTFILRVEPPESGSESKAVVFRFDESRRSYVVQGSFTSSILTQEIQNQVVIIVSDTDGTIFYLNETYRAGEDLPLLCVLKPDGTIVVRKKLSEILPQPEVEVMTRASAKAKKDGLGYDWVESITIMDDGSYWIGLEETHREAKTEFFGDYLFVSQKNWEITRRKDSDLEKEKAPNQSSEPTPTSVTTPAAQEIAPAAVVAHL